VELTAEATPTLVRIVPAAPETEELGPVFTYDPAYPNVLMLPSPVTGENSSIRTLTLD
jgi:hypothetical protein